MWFVHVVQPELAFKDGRHISHRVMTYVGVLTVVLGFIIHFSDINCVNVLM